MPIRTVTLAPEARQIPLSPAEWRRRLERLSADANAAIAAGRPGDLQALFTELDAWGEPQRAYQGRRLLVEIAFETANRLGDAAVVSLYLTVADRLLDTLAAEPSEPVLLNYAGVLLYELGELGAAEGLFRAARRLDSELEHVDANLEQVQRRKSAGRDLRSRLVAGRARPLLARARRAASAARAAQDQTVTLTMIVKDEEELLPGCLAAAAGAVDELVVVDTGSTDRTVEIAESFGAKVVHFPWNGSFADARNVSLEHATGDWILYLDADEHLVLEDAPLIRTLLGRTWREGFYLAETNYTGGEEAGSAVAHLALRLFRNKPEYRFEGRIHEQKTGAMPTFLPERFETTGIRVRHYGYLKSRIGAREKSRRNIELLLEEAREAPSPFVDFNLGSEYVALGEFERARKHLAGAWTALRTDPGWAGKGYAPMLVARLAQAEREGGDPAAARHTINEALVNYPDHTELVLQAALCARDEGNLDGAVALAERCLAQGDAPARYAAAIGVGTYLARTLLAELRTAQGRRDEAEEQYRLSLAEHPDYIAPVLPLTSLRLARGAEVDATCEALAAGRPTAALLLAAALYEGGRTAEAETRFRAVLAARPGTAVARIGLVETLLAQQRYTEAAAEAALEPADSPMAAAAGEAELFAYAAAGDASGLALALATADDRHVSPGAVTLYRAWQALLAGAELPLSLPAASGTVALTALEALLRVLELTAFEQLHRLLELSGLDERERCEGLACLYLRRGFLDSAADEWLAVARSRPDARAYVGLAQVALARGLRDDARTLAAEALVLEPANAAARRLQEAA